MFCFVIRMLMCLSACVIKIHHLIIFTCDKMFDAGSVLDLCLAQNEYKVFKEGVIFPFSVVDLQGIQTDDLLMTHLNGKFKIFSPDNKTLLCNLSKIFVEI